MGTKQTLTWDCKRAAAPTARMSLLAGAMMLMSAMAAAQDGSSASRTREDLGFFGNIGRWFEEQGQWVNSGFRDAGRSVENFGREAGVAAKTTVNTAKDAADAVARIPKARVIAGHEKCRTAPNGAPDCVAAATAACKAKGFDFGKSVDMTTAEVCPPKVLMSGRSGGSECRTETFVSRVLCQ
jgi:hypothetical protein